MVLFTGNTRGDADAIAQELGIDWIEAKDANAKKEQAQLLEPATCVSIGNGLIDLELTKLARLGIVTLQAEGIHTQTLLVADIVVPTIIDALDLLIEPERLVATLRT